MRKILLSGLLSLLSVMTAGAENDPRAANLLAQKSLTFTENKGQIVDVKGLPQPDVLFTAQLSGVKIFFGKNGLSYVFSKFEAKKRPDKAKLDPRAETESALTSLYRMDVRLEGANPTPTVLAQDAVREYSNYYLPQGTFEYVKAYQKIVYQNVYPNVDWVFYAGEGGLKYDFVVRPGGKVSDIRLRYDAADKIALNKDGKLETFSPYGKIIEDAPVSYALGSDGKKRNEISSRFALEGKLLTFSVGDYDKNQTLVIDPLVRVFATFYGGTGLEQANDLALDSQNNTHFGGTTTSINFPVSTGAFDVSYNGDPGDAFVVKMNANGNQLWATYYGGSNEDKGNGIAAKNDAVVITGNTKSLDLNAQNGFGGGVSDAFIAYFNHAGVLQWATYFGGSIGGFTMDELGGEVGNAAAFDPQGNIYIVGTTVALDFPIQSFSGAYNQSVNGDTDAFILELTSSGELLWSTYYGGSSDDAANKIAVNATGIAVVGRTESTDLPNGAQNSYSGVQDAFIARFNINKELIFARYIGGSAFDEAYGVALDEAGNAYVAGLTQSNNLSLVNLAGAYNQTTFGGFIDGFVAAFSPDGPPVWTTFVGGSGQDELRGVATTPDGGLFVVGRTRSASLPNIIVNPFQNQQGGNDFDILLIKFNANRAIEFGTYYGGSARDEGFAVASDASGCAIVVGGTLSSNFPVGQSGAGNVFQSGLLGSQDAIVLKLCNPSCGTPSGLTVMPLGPGSVLLQWDVVPGAVSYTLRYRKAGGGWLTLNLTPNYHQLTGLSTEANYEWTVSAKCLNVGAGAYAATQTFVANGGTPPCIRPTGLTVTPNSTTVATANWNAAPGAVAYEVQYRRTVGGAWVALTTPAIALPLTGLQAGTLYTVRLRSICENNVTTSWAPAVTFQTPAGKDGVIQTFVADDETFTNVSLYPNPNRGAFTLHFEATEERSVLVELFDVTGRVAWTKEYFVTEGDNQLSISAELSRGLYLLRMGDYSARVVVE